MKNSIIIKLSVSLILLLLCACSNDSNELASICGTLRDGEVFLDIDEDSGTLVDITSVTDGNLLTIRDAEEGTVLLILLNGVAEQTERRKAAAIESLVLSRPTGARFFRSERLCTTSVGLLSEIIPGQIFLNDGTSLNEELLIRGLTTYSQQDLCQSNLIRNCYQGLSIQAQ